MCSESIHYTEGRAQIYSLYLKGQRRDLDELEEPVSPPSTPFPQKHVKIIHESDDEADIENSEL